MKVYRMLSGQNFLYWPGALFKMQDFYWPLTNKCPAVWEIRTIWSAVILWNIFNLIFGVTKARAELAISEQKQTEHKILNGTLSLTPMAIAKNVKPMIDVWNNKDPRISIDSLFSGFNNAEKGYNPAKDDHRAYELFIRIEQAPNPNSRITLDTEQDALGLPKSVLHWELTPLEKRSIRKIHELLGQQIGKSGLGRVKMMAYLKDENDISWPDFVGGGWHHMGTTRMSNDPKQGVVDSNCRVHGISNLFIAGASCYATAAAPNPTLTIVALTLRLSDHIKDSIRNLHKKTLSASTKKKTTVITNEIGQS